jgi:streptomycin 6-kinase
MPHFEAEHEIEGLRFWDGDAVVRVLATAEDLGAILLERCIPGNRLRDAPEAEQDVVIARLLRRLWREPPPDAPFRPLSSLIEYWWRETLEHQSEWSDSALVREGLDLLHRLAADDEPRMLLATDMHAGNVLRAEREPWLAIDPKPFVGDPAYDATQHLLNCQARLRADPTGTIRQLAHLLGVDPERVRLWLFARLAAEPRADWSAPSPPSLARLL